MTKNTKGCLWMGLPMLFLPLILAAWALISFMMSSVVASGADVSTGAVTIARIVNVVLGFLGIIGVIMIPVGFVVGIIMFTRKDDSVQVQPTQDEPPSTPPIQPPTEHTPV
ncbi:MAG: hypothetical protein WCK01_05745 [Candidatus Uhrbacteria bacterium]